MNTVLTGLGISPEIQALFNITGLVFSYGGNCCEHFGEGFHKVPTTENLWLAGDQSATHVLIAFSVMELLAFLTLNKNKYPNPERLAYIATGNRIYDEQMEWIREHFRNRKFTLVFSNDLVGRLADIKMASGISGRQFSFYHVNGHTIIREGNRVRSLADEELSLNAFKIAFNFHTRVRTGKSRNNITFLDQLIHDTRR